MLEKLKLLLQDKKKSSGQEYKNFPFSLPEADKWYLSRYILDDLIPLVGVHPFPLDELLLMCSVVAFFKPDIIFDWGTNIGVSARIFYEINHHLRLNSDIHSIDLPIEVSHIENIKDKSKRGFLVNNLEVDLHLGDGLETSIKIFKSGSFTTPLFFLVGDHSFESVQRELNGIKKEVSQAVVLVHDTFCQGPESGYNCGPHLAISTFCKEQGLNCQSTLLGLPGMSLIYWKKNEV